MLLSMKVCGGQRGPSPVVDQGDRQSALVRIVIPVDRVLGWHGLQSRCLRLVVPTQPGSLLDG